MKRIEVGDTVMFSGEVIEIVDDLIHFEGETVRIWRGDSRIVAVLPHGWIGQFNKLCEEYADAADGAAKLSKARQTLLDFCHTYAYKINGVEPW